MVRARLAERVRAHIVLARKQINTYAFERSNSSVKLSPNAKSKVKCLNCRQMITVAKMADHSNRCQPRGRSYGRTKAIKKGPIAQLVEYAQTRGIPEAAIREQLSRAGTNLEEIRATLEKLPAVENHAYSATAVSAFRKSLSITHLPFTLLPPGTWDAHRVIDRYQEINSSAAAWAGPKLDLNRLTALVSLGPARCYLGTELFSWYVLFEFDSFHAAVLECPYEGNAAYIIHGEWRNVVGLTKQEIRTNHPDRCTWVVHRNNWMKRIRDALQRDPGREQPT